MQRLNRDKNCGYSYTANPSFPNTINRKSKRNPLGKAIETGQWQIVKRLIENKHIAPNHVGDGETALIVAIQENKEQIAMELWNHYMGEHSTTKLDLTKPNASGETALHLAIQHSYQPLTTLLIDNLSINHFISQIYRKDHKGRTPLHTAARYNNSQALKQLLNLLAQQKGNVQAIHKLFEKDIKGKRIAYWAYSQQRS